jgi:DNA-directed RNA polymerase specialized sigma subunit
MKDYRIDLKVRNNLLLTEIEKTGLSIPQFAKEANCDYSKLITLINMKITAVSKKTGDYIPMVHKICAYLNVMPVHLFNDIQMYDGLVTNKHTIAVDDYQVNCLIANQDPTKAIEHQDQINVFDKVFANYKFTDNEKFVLNHIYGLDCEAKTHEEIGKLLNLGKMRIRQIEAKALRKCRSKPELLELM